MKRRIAVVALALVLLVGAVYAARWWSHRGTNQNGLSVSGTVEATEARLGFQSAGRIVSIDVREGDRVTAGAVLAHLDDAQLVAQRAQALARVNATSAMLAELERGSRTQEIATATAAEQAAQVKLEDARRDLARSKRLYDGGAIPLEQYQKAQAAAEIAEAQLEQTREQRSLVQTGPRAGEIEAQRAQVGEARAAVEAVDALLRNTAIVAPLDGVVTVRHREVNETVAPGQPVLTLMNPRDRWVRVYVPENRLAAVHIGTAATIKSDTFPDRTYRGRVVYVAQEAEFTPKNVQTQEERVKLVYAVKVSIEGDERVELKPGTPADVVLATRSEP